MARLILFVCAVVALSSMTFAAPLAQEEDNAQQRFLDIESLLKEADSVENDIARNVEVTESTTEVPTVLPVQQDAVEEEAEKEQVQPTTDVEITSSTVSVVEDASSDEPTKEQEFHDTVEEIIKKYGEDEENTKPAADTAVETVDKVEGNSANNTKPVDVKITTDQEDLLTPVTEVIPPPKVAFVLGEYADQEEIPEPANENNDEDEVVLGETEDGTPVLSEYQPDILPNNQEEGNADDPLVEQIDHEYPQEAIIPEAEFRPFEGPVVNHDDVMYDDYNPGPFSHPNDDYNPGLFSHQDDDYSSDYDSVSPDYGVNDDHYDSMYPHDFPMMTHAPDYPMEPFFDGRLDYGDDSLTMPYDGSHHDYDASASNTEEDHMTDYDTLSDQTMPDNMHPMSELPMHDDLKAAMATEQNNLPHAIVVGLHENYHPEPILGMIPFQTEFPEDSSAIIDDSIRPSAMVNFDSPAVENTNFEDDMMDTRMPEIPSMVDLLRPVAEFPVNNPPMASMHPVDEDDMSYMNDNNEDTTDGDINGYDVAQLEDRLPQPIYEDETITNELDMESKPEIVIELDIDSQQAMVNGKTFVWERPSSILGFIGKILKASRIRSKFPQESNESPSGKPYNNRDSMSFPETYQYAPAYTYPSSNSYNYQPEQYQPSSFDYDYLPFNPFLSALSRRLLEARFNKMQSFGHGYGYNYMSGYSPMQGYGPRYDDYSMGGYNPMQGYNSIPNYDDSVSGYNPMQGYNSINDHDDSMGGYNPMQGYGQNGRSFDSFLRW